MPTYTYVCSSCEYKFDAVQGFIDAALTDCQVCEQGRLRKRYTPVGVVFKGRGFYSTDQ